MLGHVNGSMVARFSGRGSGWRVVLNHMLGLSKGR